MKIRRQKINGTTFIYVDDLPCKECGTPICQTVCFTNGEPMEMLCQRCRAKYDREDYGIVVLVTEFSKPKISHNVVSDFIGKSSGKERKFMCYGDAENANGLWDNMIHALEENEAES